MIKKLSYWLLLPVFVAFTLALAGCNQPPSSQAFLEKTIGDVQVQVFLPTAGFKVQREAYTLKLHSKSGHLPAELPDVQVMMPMEGGEPMHAPTTIKPGKTPDTDELNSEFTMAGNWTLQVRSSKDTKPVTLTLPVSE